MTFWRRINTRLLLRYRFNGVEIPMKTIHNVALKNINITSKLVNLNPENVSFSAFRCKSNKKQNKYHSDDEDDDIFNDDSSLSKDSKVVKFSTTSMRTDAILKSALGVARNKIEQLFYESKIRVNGKKILKKSASVKLGDEVDVIKMVSPKNSGHLYIARVEILNITPKEESINITVRRFKNLLIENYENDPHKVNEESDEGKP